MRKSLPSRRLSWTQSVKIENQRFYLTCGEREDGSLGEVWLEAHKQGTFSRGVLGALARVVSIALQCKTPIEDVVKSLRGLNFPPNGQVVGSEICVHATSVADWVAQEIASVYCPAPAIIPTEKLAGTPPEKWRRGV